MHHVKSTLKKSRFKACVSFPFFPEPVDESLCPSFITKINIQPGHIPSGLLLGPKLKEEYHCFCRKGWLVYIITRGRPGLCPGNLSFLLRSSDTVDEIKNDREECQ